MTSSIQKNRKLVTVSEQIDDINDKNSYLQKNEEVASIKS